MHHFPLAAAGLFFIAGATNALQNSPPMVVPPTPGDPVSAPALITWHVDRIACSDGDRPSGVLAPVQPEVGWTTAGQARQQVTYDFVIDSEGRAETIQRNLPTYVQASSDLAPALAATRFAAGGPRHDCHITFAATRTPFAVAKLDDLIVATIRPVTTPPRAIFDAIRPKGSTCTDPNPTPLLVAFPDFAKISPVPGRPGWSMIRFDVNDAGRTAGVKLVASTGNVTLDIASRDAVARSRFDSRRKSGCLYPYWQNAGVLHAPGEMPDRQSFRAADANCPGEVEWASKPPSSTRAISVAAASKAGRW